MFLLASPGRSLPTWTMTLWLMFRTLWTISSGKKLISGFTPDAVGVPDTASHRLLLISAPAWRCGEHSRLVMSSTAVM